MLPKAKLIQCQDRVIPHRDFQILYERAFLSSLERQGLINQSLCQDSIQMLIHGKSKK